MQKQKFFVLLLLVTVFVHKNYGYYIHEGNVVREVIPVLPQCKDPNGKKCIAIKEGMEEFIKASNSRRGRFYNSSIEDIPYFKEVLDEIKQSDNAEEELKVLKDLLYDDGYVMISDDLLKAYCKRMYDNPESEKTIIECLVDLVSEESSKRKREQRELEAEEKAREKKREAEKKASILEELKK